MTDLDTGAYEQLDFDDDDEALTPHSKEAQDRHAVAESKEKQDLTKDERTSDLEESMEDDGELKSEDESDLNATHSSEEGEVLSEFEELEVTVEQSPAKDETPWERGVRLARERLQKVKVIKASEKDLAEKRMNLAVPTSAVEEESDQVSKEEILWPCYYQLAIVGRTELTGLRFLPEDLQPPTATEIAEWRLGLSDTRRGRQRRRRDRVHSRSGSSSVSSSSAASSRSSSTDSMSAASSLASVAASWKATCAQALKDYLSSPIRNKDRRGGRGRGTRPSRSVSSESNSQSSDSRSASEQSEDRVGHRTYRSTRGARGGSGLPGRDSRRYWAESKRTSRPSRSNSERSSKSRSGSRSSAASRPDRAWNYDKRRPRKDEEWQESPNRSGSASSPVRRRSDVPPLPHERPVKRPWVAAPGMATGLVSNRPRRGTRRRSGGQSGSSSRSGSQSSQAGEERQFITSWSRSPSTGTAGRAGRQTVRRERLPDVVPGIHATRSHRAASPRRRKSRSPFAEAKNGPTLKDAAPYIAETATPHDELPVPRRTPQTQQYSESTPYAAQQVPPEQHQREEPERDVTVEANNQPQPVVGELPSASSRPGVKITLAPRLKSSAVDMAALAGGVTRPSGGRTNQPSPPPRLPRLPFPIPLTTRGNSPSAAPTEAPFTVDQEEIRRQAEAAAAIVEARERRRAAAEAARRRRNPKKKRDDLSKIPIRGRPTYRRRSFTDSSLESGSSKSSRSTSRSSSATKSGSASPVEPKSTRKMEQQSVQQNIDFHAQRPHGSRKRHRAEVTPGQAVFGEPDEMAMHRSRHAPRGMPGEFRPQRNEFPERHQHRPTINYGGIQRHRDERTMELTESPYKSNAGMQLKGMHMDYGFDNTPTYPPGATRHRESKSGMGNISRHRNTNNEFIQGYQDAPRGVSRRMGPTAPQPMERITRPRTPHADGGSDDFGSRTTAGLMWPSKHVRKRHEERELDNAPVKKRAMIAEPVMEPSINLELRRARSRHRSRGPGGPIDRSEPFESDAGSFAAEQRLRELRERLNFVDDAIAELRAGSSTGFPDSRR